MIRKEEEPLSQLTAMPSASPYIAELYEYVSRSTITF